MRGIQKIQNFSLFVIIYVVGFLDQQKQKSILNECKFNSILYSAFLSFLFYFNIQYQYNKRFISYIIKYCIYIFLEYVLYLD